MWSLSDLKSANGVFVNGKRVETASIPDGLAATLGVDGPCVTMEVEQRGQSNSRPGPLPQTVERRGSETKLLASYAERYFGSGKTEGPSADGR